MLRCHLLISPSNLSHSNWNSTLVTFSFLTLHQRHIKILKNPALPWWILTYPLLHAWRNLHCFCTQDGLLCCSYNFHCGDDALALGYDGSVATAPSLDRNVSSVSDVKNNHTKHSSGVRGTVYASDSAGSNKTEDTGNWTLFYIPLGTCEPCRTWFN